MRIDVNIDGGLHRRGTAREQLSLVSDVQNNTEYQQSRERGSLGSEREVCYLTNSHTSTALSQ